MPDVTLDVKVLVPPIDVIVVPPTPPVRLMFPLVIVVVPLFCVNLVVANWSCNVSVVFLIYVSVPSMLTLLIPAFTNNIEPLVIVVWFGLMFNLSVPSTF